MTTILVVTVGVIVAGAAVVIQRLVLAAATALALEPATEAEVNEKTRQRAASFSACGYRWLAVYRGRTREARFSIVVMSGPDGTSWAEVTDRLWEAASTFGPRLLRTATDSMMPPGPALVQCVPSAAPETIVAEHGRALVTLAGRGLRPDRLADDELLLRFESETRDAQAILKRSMWRTAVDLAWRKPLRRHHGRPALADDPRAGARIDAWLAAH